MISLIISFNSIIIISVISSIGSISKSVDISYICVNFLLYLYFIVITFFLCEVDILLKNFPKFSEKIFVVRFI